MLVDLYNHGVWENCTLLDNEDGEDNDQWLIKNEYATSEFVLVGDPESRYISMFYGKTSGYLIEMCFGTEISQIVIKDTPSLLQFMKEYLPVFNILREDDFKSFLENVIGKFFEAYHGHDHTDCCVECDRLQYQKNVKAHQQWVNEKLEKLKASKDAS